MVILCHCSPRACPWARHLESNRHQRRTNPQQQPKLTKRTLYRTAMAKPPLQRSLLSLTPEIPHQNRKKEQGRTSLPSNSKSRSKQRNSTPQDLLHRVGTHLASPATATMERHQMKSLHLLWRLTTRKRKRRIRRRKLTRRTLYQLLRNRSSSVLEHLTSPLASKIKTCRPKKANLYLRLLLNLHQPLLRLFRRLEDWPLQDLPEAQPLLLPIQKYHL